MNDSLPAGTAGRGSRASAFSPVREAYLADIFCAPWLVALEEAVGDGELSPDAVGRAVVRGELLQAAPYLPSFREYLRTEMAADEARAERIPDKARVSLEPGVIRRVRRRREILEALDRLTVRRLLEVYAEQMKEWALGERALADRRGRDFMPRSIARADAYEAAAAHAVEAAATRTD